jgi:hypothetical protein
MVRIEASRRIGEGICSEHLNKVIFLSAAHAVGFAKYYYPERDSEAYKCPEIRSHYHIRDKKKRATRKYHQRENRRNRR